MCSTILTVLLLLYRNFVNHTVHLMLVVPLTVHNTITLNGKIPKRTKQRFINMICNYSSPSDYTHVTLKQINHVPLINGLEKTPFILCPLKLPSYTWRSLLHQSFVCQRVTSSFMVTLQQFKANNRWNKAHVNNFVLSQNVDVPDGFVGKGISSRNVCSCSKRNVAWITVTSNSCAYVAHLSK